jgi:hypothetical protein
VEVYFCTGNSNLLGRCECCDNEALAESYDEMKNALRFFAGFAIPFGIIGVLFLALWAKDVRQDRKHTVTVNSPTTIFAGSGDEDCDRRQQLTTVQPGAVLHIQRIRYWKNCATLDVALSDGRKGYVVLGVGNVSVYPPLP